MKQLAREVNARIEGIRLIEPDAIIDVSDSHGPGGLYEEESLAEITGGEEFG